MNNAVRSLFQAHPFHLVSPSPWPVFTALAAFSLVLSLVLLFQSFTSSPDFILICIWILSHSMGLWFRDMISEGTYKGNHTLAVQRGITMGVGLFIISEVFFFLAIFWAFFHSALAPTIEVGAQWPPKGIDAINPFELPLLNTVLLLSSGVTVTFSHHSLIKFVRIGALYGSIYTLCLSSVFTGFQGVEYTVSSFTISDGIYASCFYFGTGFHGLHVLIGTAFLAVGLWRIYTYQVTNNHHLGVESGIMYWHFVDIVWLVLFFSVYLWGTDR